MKYQEKVFHSTYMFIRESYICSQQTFYVIFWWVIFRIKYFMIGRPKGLSNLLHQASPLNKAFRLQNLNMAELSKFKNF